jgi:RES domain-containing protein
VSDVLVWRLCAAHRLPMAFSGEGAARRGGRWNAPGARAVYTADSRALAIVEVLVNAEDRDRLGALEWVFVSASIPGELIEKPAKYPQSWRDYPHRRETQLFGSEWVQARRSAALRVPSAVVPGEFNYLLNPAHPQFAKVKVGKPEPFSFDPRLA